MTDLRLVGTTETGDTVPILVNADGAVVLEEKAGPPPGPDPWTKAWELHLVPGASGLASVVWGPEAGVFVATHQGTGSAGAFWSIDGKGWTATDLPGDRQWHRIRYSRANQQFLAISESLTDSRIARSDDGKAWTVSPTPVNAVAIYAQWLTDQGAWWLCCMTSPPKIYFSVDGINWALQSTNLQAVTSSGYNGDTGTLHVRGRLTTGSDRHLVSSDGMNFADSGVGSGMQTNAVYVWLEDMAEMMWPGNGTPTEIFVGGESAHAHYAGSVLAGTASALCWCAGPGLAVVASSVGSIQISADLHDWHRALVRSEQRWSGLAYCEQLKRLVAVGRSYQGDMVATLDL